MPQKIIIKCNKESNLMEALTYYMEMEKLSYDVINDIDSIDEDVTNLIYIDDNDFDVNSVRGKEHTEVILVSDKKKDLSK